MNEDGVCAGLTNQPLGDAKDPTKRSRGELPLAAVRCPTAAAGVETLVRDYDPREYNGAWLLVGDRTSLYFVDFTGAEVTVAELPPGIHVLENRSVDDALAQGRPRALGGRLARTGDAMVAAFGRCCATTGSPRATSVRTRRRACISTSSGRGRRASCASARRRACRPRMWVADGPPCTASYVDVGGLWGRWLGRGRGRGEVEVGMGPGSGWGRGSGVTRAQSMSAESFFGAIIR